MKKKSLLLFAIIPLLFSCGKEDTLPPPEEPNSYVVDFSTVSSGFNNDNKDNFATKMKTVVNKDSELVTSVDTVGYVQVSQLDMINTEAPYSEYILHALLTSSAKQDGEITFTFAKELKLVKIYAQAYFKTYHHYGGDDEPEVAVSSDKLAKIKVNNTEWDMSHEKGNFETPDQLEKEFAVSKNTLTINGYSAQRVFIHKLEFTF